LQAKRQVLAGQELRQRLLIVGRQIERTDVRAFAHLVADEEFAEAVPGRRASGAFFALIAQHSELRFQHLQSER
jgi:hypothetical protein